MNMTDLQLLELQVDALYTHDAAGRIVAINEPEGGSAPRFFLGRTRVGNMWRPRHDLPEAMARRLSELATAEPVTEDLRAEPRNLDGFLEALQADQTLHIWCGPAYYFPDTLSAPNVTVTSITRASTSLLSRMNWDQAALARDFEQSEPMFAIVEDDVAVSLCFSSRLTARAAEAGVETLEAYRGRGYAPAVVSAWARAVRASGRVPLYSTSWNNRASQAVARKLSLAQYATDFSLG